MKAISSRRTVGLGFRRLSIIDLAGGHQPMSDAEETVWVAFNGEIYNFKELRGELEAARPSISDQLRYGGNHSRLQRMGHGGFQSSQWHVWAGNLGRAKRAAGRGARCHGHQTDLLQDRQWPADLWIGNPADPGSRRFQAGCRSGGAQSFPSFSLHAFAA